MTKVKKQNVKPKESLTGKKAKAARSRDEIRVRKVMVYFVGQSMPGKLFCERYLDGHELTDRQLARALRSPFGIELVPGSDSIWKEDFTRLANKVRSVLNIEPKVKVEKVPKSRKRRRQLLAAAQIQSLEMLPDEIPQQVQANSSDQQVSDKSAKKCSRTEKKRAPKRLSDDTVNKGKEVSRTEKKQPPKRLQDQQVSEKSAKEVSRAEKKREPKHFQYPQISYIPVKRVSRTEKKQAPKRDDQEVSDEPAKEVLRVEKKRASKRDDQQVSDEPAKEVSRVEKKRAPKRLQDETSSVNKAKRKRKQM
jgi:hypothetical protein